MQRRGKARIGKGKKTKGKGDGREKRNRARRKVDRPILISKSRRLWSQALPADNVCVCVRVCVR